MCVLNDLDRFHLVMDVIDRVPELAERAAYVSQAMREKRIEHRRYVVTHGDDMPDIRDWQWRGRTATPSGYQEKGVSETAADGAAANRDRADTAADNV